jgi:hypothetical protein
MLMNEILTSEYKEFLTEIKNKINSSRLRAALSVNYEVIFLYLYIGQ